MQECIFHPDYDLGKVLMRDEKNKQVLVDFGDRIWVDVKECAPAPPGYDLYFAYGSNLHLPQMMRRCPDAEAITQGILRGYDLRYRGVATIDPVKGKQVYGAVYMISPRDLKKLDAYEGYPSLYYRYKVPVETKFGIMECLTYRMHDKYEMSRPSSHYVRTIEEGYQYWGLPLSKFNNR